MAGEVGGARRDDTYAVQRTRGPTPAEARQQTPLHWRPLPAPPGHRKDLRHRPAQHKLPARRWMHRQGEGRRRRPRGNSVSATARRPAQLHVHGTQWHRTAAEGTPHIDAGAETESLNLTGGNRRAVPGAPHATPRTTSVSRHRTEVVPNGCPEPTAPRTHIPVAPDRRVRDSIHTLGLHIPAHARGSQGRHTPKRRASVPPCMCGASTPPPRALIAPS